MLSILKTKSYQINQRVKLVVVPNCQFKTVQLAINFASTASSPQIVSERALLSYVQAVSSSKYINQQAVARQLISLFGSQYQTDVQLFGNQHQVRFLLQCPNPQYINQNSDYLEANLAFIKSMIFKPLLDSASSFNGDVVSQERQSLLNELLSLADDKVDFALAQLRQLTIPVPALQSSALGKVAEIQAVSSQQLYQSHQWMIYHDQVTITVLGDVDADQLFKTFSQWPWGDVELATQTDESPFMDLSQQELSIKNESRPQMEQAVLTKNYLLPINPSSDQRFTAMVLNAMFGGAPISKLFMNIREKHSLCYSIVSRWQLDWRLLTVIVGLGADTVDQVSNMIELERQSLATGDFSDQLLADVKEMLINDYLSQLDVPMSLLSMILRQQMTQLKITPQEWIAKIKAVKRDDIQSLAQQMRVICQYNLLPEEL